MAGQQGRGTIVGRAALGLVALAIGLSTALLEPVAVASPLGEADDAITAAWKAAGGDTSDLGAKQGECYVAGQGFAQDFVHGKMFFTPATGAKAMSGAVLDKYEALGGPAASDLGFPTINEVPGLAGRDSRVSTFSASDKPLIFWTPEHGAFVVRGAINAAWDRLGSSGGALGVPVGDETYDGELATQAFSSGRVSWDRLTKAFTTVPPDLATKLTDLQVPIDPTAAINMAWRAAGGPSGTLGAKQGDQYPVGGDGLAQNFDGGKIFFSPATGANAIESDVLAKYESLGGPGGSLGFPIANEADGALKPASRVSPFAAADKPVIFWTSDHGAFVVRGAIKAAWDKLDGATGKLGAPVGEQTANKDVLTQKFTGGQIAWNQAKNTFSTQPANLASSLSGLQVPGQKTPAGSSTGGGHSGLNWRRWLLPVGILALVLLVGAAALVGLRRRLRRAAGRDTKAAALDRRDEAGYEAVTESVSRWSPDADIDLASSSLSDDDYRAALRPRTVRLPSKSANDWMPPGRADLVDEPRSDDLEDHAEFSELDDDLDVHVDEHFDEHSEDHLDEHLEDHLDEDHFDEDPDSVDTAPTRIPTASELRGGRHAATDAEDADTTHFAAAAPITHGQLAIHLPMDDPYEVPDGYPVKANASFGVYYMPDSALYEDTLAEIWFATEEIAQANGFIRAE